VTLAPVAHAARMTYRPPSLVPVWSGRSMALQRRLNKWWPKGGPTSTPTGRATAESLAGNANSAPTSAAATGGRQGDVSNARAAAAARPLSSAEETSGIVSEAMHRVWKGPPPAIETATKVGEVRAVSYLPGAQGYGFATTNARDDLVRALDVMQVEGKGVNQLKVEASVAGETGVAALSSGAVPSGRCRRTTSVEKDYIPRSSTREYGIRRFLVPQWARGGHGLGRLEYYFLPNGLRRRVG
jgi:hypothetical protein